MSEHRVSLIGGGGDEMATVVLTHVADECRIELRYRDRVLNSAAGDFFEALCKIRLELEKEQLIPFCYGASINVYPSGMARDMAHGLRAYKLTLGKHAQLADLVELFSEGADVIPAYVDMQNEFFQDWISSLRN